jgi:hypothetical protein
MLHFAENRWMEFSICTGNPSVRSRTKPISDRYAYIAEEKLPENIQKKLKLEPGATYGDAVALRTFHAALEGDIAATREIREAIEGKSTIRTDDERPPIRIDISAIPKHRERSLEALVVGKPEADARETLL